MGKACTVVAISFSAFCLAVHAVWLWLGPGCETLRMRDRLQGPLVRLPDTLRWGLGS